MESRSTRGTDHDDPDDFITDCPGFRPTGKRAKEPVDLKHLCLTKVGNLQCN